MAEIFNVDPENKILKTSMGDIVYNYLVIATGCTTNYYNFEPVKNKLLTLKSITDALDIRSFIMQNLEEASVVGDPLKQESLINIAIVGGGPAGIEIAGTLAEMKKYVLPKDFPELDLNRMHLYLFEAAPELLSVMSDEASEASLQYLQKMGINIHLNAKVKSYDGFKIILEDGSEFQTNTVLWTAGVKGESFQGLPSDCVLPGNRLSVNQFNQVKGFTDIFAIGDIAACISDANPKGLPMLAPVAIQQARQLALNIGLLIRKKSLVLFHFHNKGIMATVGKKRAVVDLPKWKFQGHFAWFVWMFVHIMSLVGFRNKLITFIDWSMNYFSYDRPLGLIIRPFKKRE
jgi:NADH dehydrogenase